MLYNKAIEYYIIRYAVVFTISFVYLLQEINVNSNDMEVTPKAAEMLVGTNIQRISDKSIIILITVSLFHVSIYIYIYNFLYTT